MTLKICCPHYRLGILFGKEPLSKHAEAHPTVEPMSQKLWMLHIRHAGGEAVLLYCEPPGTKEMGFP